MSKVKAPKQDSRHIPADVRRKVWKRDGGRCAFIGKNGRRCDQRGFLEFHHVVPYGVGGQATVENIQLRCRAHNGYEADQYFGNQGFGGVRETNRNSFQNEFVKVSQFPVEAQGTKLKHDSHEYPPLT